MLRTHTCGALREEHIGQRVTLSGWVYRRRDHGKLTFIDLRDRYGVTQVVFLPKSESSEDAKKLRNEDVICIEGEVALRPKGTINDKIPTGKVEVAVTCLKILNACDDLPFNIDDVSVSEELRFLHRYIDLRSEGAVKRMSIRSSMNHIMRSFLISQDFLEIETPFLTKSTPEGARDFLVPARLNPGMFYALPQSPQLFKQILMVSGMDRYFQIVRCFRDEDLRKDRQPEFTQLDLEMSFVDQEDMFALVERMLFDVFKNALGEELSIPFPRISYEKAMKDYGSDKPHINKDRKFDFLWVTDFPLFKYNEAEGRIDSEHHPFTMPNQDDIEFLGSSPLKVRSTSYDLVLNGQEIGSGSLRVHDLKLQKEIFDILKISSEMQEQKFGFLLRALRFGAPPHGGIALGLDRLSAIVSNVDSIREVIAFPKTQKGVCLLSGAPSEVDISQLQDLSLELREDEKRLGESGDKK